MTTILITGVGGPLGQALIKAARRSSVPCRIVGTDRSPYSIGLGWVECPHVIASASYPEAYIDEIRGVCETEHVKLILPGSDSELELLSKNADLIMSRTGAKVVASPPELLGIAMDKWQTGLFLKKVGRNYPRSIRLNGINASRKMVEELGFPLIAKPCRGSGSRGLFKVRSWDDIRYLGTLDYDMVLQEYLMPDEEEYTVAVYTCKNGEQAGSIIFRRELMAGNTYRAWVSDNSRVRAEAEAVVRALNPVGPCNVQLRMTQRGPVTFEINPRFSGSTAMRAYFGFNEVEMAVRDLVFGEPVPPPKIRPGFAMRFWDERYIEGNGGAYSGLRGVEQFSIIQTSERSCVS